MLRTNTQPVNFDPNKKAHREAFHAFSKRNAWADSPIRFADDPEFGSVVDQVKTKLLHWYMHKESKTK